MSLRQMLRQNRWSIQVNDFAVRNETGSIDRKEGWVTTYQNLLGNVQSTVTTSAKGKDDTIKTYNKVELESFYTIFHNYVNIIFNTNMRFLVHHNPTKKITFLTDGQVDLNIHKTDEIRIFEFVGIREPVGKRNKLGHFELYMKQIFRQSL